MKTIAMAAAAFGITTAALVSMAARAAPSHHCVRAGGSADMITQDLAEFMAKAALKNSIKGMGAKPSGPIKLVCKPGSVPVHCLARQTASK